MGVDIYGLKKEFKSPKPEINWNTATDYQRDNYIEAMDQWEEENPGHYFRSNWWGWRPIHMLADMAINVAQLPLNTDLWGENSGGGLKNQEDCNALADAMELVLLLNKKNASEDADRVYLCLGAWSNENGGFIEKDQEEKLNEQYPPGTVLYSGVVNDKGELLFPAHSAPLSHIKNFITFLRNCEGFEIF